MWNLGKCRRVLAATVHFHHRVSVQLIAGSKHQAPDPAGIGKREARGDRRSHAKRNEHGTLDPQMIQQAG
jgi:hypothetical protein